MSAKGRALPGSCWGAGGKEGATPPMLGEPQQAETRWEWGHRVPPMAVPHCCPPRQRTSSLWDTWVLLPSLLWMLRASTGMVTAAGDHGPPPHLGSALVQHRVTTPLPLRDSG